MFIDIPFFNKLKAIIEIADMKSTGFIKQKRLYDILKGLFMTPEERSRLRKESNIWPLNSIVREVSNDVEMDGHGFMRKKDFLNATKNHLKFRNMLEESIKNIRKVDKMIENDLEEHF